MSFAIVAYKSCHLQLLHTKAIAALTQFCDFLANNDNKAGTTIAAKAVNISDPT